MADVGFVLACLAMSGPPFVPPHRLLHALGQITRSRTAARFDRAARDPVRAQQALLAGYLQRNRETEFGRLHGFADLRTPASYAQRLPLLTPEALEPWVSRLLQGERKLLTIEDPIFYGLTTGSSGKHKVVPITPGYRKEFQDTVKIAFWHLYRRFPKAFSRPLLYFVGPRRFHLAADGLDVGSMSGYNFTEQSPLVRALYAWPAELFGIQDLQDRSYVALYLAILGDVSLITGVFPLAIISMLRDLETRAGELAHDLDRGTLEGAPSLTLEQRAFFTSRAGKRPDLADRLKRASRAPVDHMAALAFPHLGLVYCWATATAGSYIPELQRRLGPTVPVRDAIYAATEAWCNIPLGDEETGGPLAVTSVYFEFIEEAAYEAGNRQTVPLEGVVDGKRYYIVVTNASGLYRYVIGDIVEVCGQYLGTPRIRFVRKTGTSCNLAGEQLDEAHVNAAVATVLARHSLEATWFAMVADTSGPQPGYDLLIELAPGHGDLAGGDLANLGIEVEADLERESFNYGLHRGGGRLRPLAVSLVPRGSYGAWRRRRVAAGTTEAQLKSVHLHGDPAGLPEEFRNRL